MFSNKFKILHLPFIGTMWWCPYPNVNLSCINTQNAQQKKQREEPKEMKHLEPKQKQIILKSDSPTLFFWWSVNDLDHNLCVSFSHPSFYSHIDILSFLVYTTICLIHQSHNHCMISLLHTHTQIGYWILVKYGKSIRLCPLSFISWAQQKSDQVWPWAYLRYLNAQR